MPQVANIEACCATPEAEKKEQAADRATVPFPQPVADVNQLVVGEAGLEHDGDEGIEPVLGRQGGHKPQPQHWVEDRGQLGYLHPIVQPRLVLIMAGVGGAGVLSLLRGTLLPGRSRNRRVRELTASLGKDNIGSTCPRGLDSFEEP